MQEVFVDCFKPTGVLARVQEGWPGGFRAYFYGVVRNVARTFERRRARQRVNPPQDTLGADRIEGDEEGLSTVFDRAWTVAMMREVAERQAALAAAKDDGAVRRVELLRLRFHEGLPIRDIARLWEKDPAWVHHEYAKARREFQVALRDVVSTQHPGSNAEVDEQCQRPFDFLS